jgi:hypothetical protein
VDSDYLFGNVLAAPSLLFKGKNNTCSGALVGLRELLSYGEIQIHRWAGQFMLIARLGYPIPDSIIDDQTPFFLAEEASWGLLKI